MAKNIKAIKCPQCGSTKVTEIRTDYFRCNSCGTEFFLDSDDININHNYRYTDSGNQLGNTNNKKLVWYIWGAMVIFILGPMLFHTLFNHSSTGRNSAYSAGITESKYRWNNANVVTFADNAGNPYFVTVGTVYDNSRDSDDNKVKDIYIGVYDAKNSVKKYIKVLAQFDISSGTEIDLRVLEDNNLYIILKNKLIYRLNARDLTTENIGESYMKNNKELSVGFAKVEFLYRGYGSGYEIVTNEGKNVNYMPFIDKVYPKDDFYDKRSEKLPNPEVKTGFKFSSKSDDYPEEKNKLIKYTYNYQFGYPRNSAEFEYRKNYGGSGIFTDRDPYVKQFIDKPYYRVLDYQDFTKDRTYFNPQVLAYDDNEVVIGFQATPSEDELFQIQSLDAKTGAILKVFNFQPKRVDREGNFILKDGYLITGDGYYLFDKNGKKVNSVNGYYDLKIDKLN